MAHTETAIDRNHRPSDVSRIWTDEELHDSGYFVRGSVPSERNRAEDLIPSAFIKFCCHVCLDESGCDHVHCDASRT